VPANRNCLAEGTDGDAPTTLEQRVREVWRPDVGRRPVPGIKKTRDGYPARALRFFAMMTFCQ
jgi:hypothetical protein